MEGESRKPGLVGAASRMIVGWNASFGDRGSKPGCLGSQCLPHPLPGPPMILEGLVTTVDPAGRVHLAAMGPGVNEAERASGRLSRLVLRPFSTSQTGAHLMRTHAAVFHLTDDVLLLARTVVGGLADLPAVRPAKAVAAFVLEDACLAYELELASIDDSADRLHLEANVVATHVGRPFLGFNRAAHAVVEAAILVTRLHLLDAGEIRRQFAELEPLIEKTGGDREQLAFSLLAARLERGS